MDAIEVPLRHMRGVKPDVTLVPQSWIAGGSVRRWFTGEPQTSDIDVFFASDDALAAFILANTLVESDRNDRYINFKDSRIQAILKPRFNDAAATIAHFDFTICQFAFDGECVISTVDAIACTLRKHLGVHEIQSGFEFDSLRRAFKYAKAGYWPCLGTMNELANALRRDTVDLQTQVEMSPRGGKRSIRWD